MCVHYVVYEPIQRMIMIYHWILAHMRVNLRLLKDTYLVNVTFVRKSVQHFHYEWEKARELVRVIALKNDVAKKKEIIIQSCNVCGPLVQIIRDSSLYLLPSPAFMWRVIQCILRHHNYHHDILSANLLPLFYFLHHSLKASRPFFQTSTTVKLKATSHRSMKCSLPTLYAVCTTCSL